MQLLTKILGPSCRRMGKPAGPRHKMLSKPEPNVNEIFLSRGRRWGQQGKPATWEWGRESLLISVVNSSASFIIPCRTPVPLKGTGHPRIFEEAFGGGPGPRHSPRSPFHNSLTTRPHCLPKRPGDMAFTQHLLGSLFLSALGSPRVFSLPRMFCSRFCMAHAFRTLPKGSPPLTMRIPSFLLNGLLLSGYNYVTN